MLTPVFPLNGNLNLGETRIAPHCAGERKDTAMLLQAKCVL